MAVSQDIIDLIRILNDADLAWVAGEIITEIENGHLSPSSPNAEGSIVEIPPLLRSFGKFEDEDGKLQEFEFMLDREDSSNEEARIPIPENEQLNFAVGIIERRLLEPVRRLAEAERIAGDLAALPEPPFDPDRMPVAPGTPGYTEGFSKSIVDAKKAESRTAPPVRIGFMSLADGERLVPLREAAPGSDVGVKQVKAVLDRLSNLRV